MRRCKFGACQGQIVLEEYIGRRRLDGTHDVEREEKCLSCGRPRIQRRHLRGLPTLPSQRDFDAAWNAAIVVVVGERSA